MKKVVIIGTIISFTALSCDVIVKNKSTDKDSVIFSDSLHSTKDTAIRLNTDSTLKGIGDSLQQDIHKAAVKVKERAKEVGGVLADKAKQLRHAAKAGIQSAKKELKK